jgi:hypothetical protein
VDEEVTAARQLENDILATPADADDALPTELGGDGGGRPGRCEARVEDGDVLEAASLERRGEGAADRLDLG